jgi:hypothetical protein
MKIKSVLKLLMLAVVLIVSLSFAGCNLVDGGDQFDDSGLSRKVASENKPKEFYAEVTLNKISLHDPLKMGSSNHYRMIEEQLSTIHEDLFKIDPQFIDSGWSLLNGQEVVMTNITNYNMDEDGNINGSNHSTINIMSYNEDIENYELVLTLEAHGTIVGNLITGAFLDMNWTSVKGSGTFKGNARGKITGYFFWHEVQNDEDGNPIIVPIYPYGDFELTGTYK